MINFTQPFAVVSGVLIAFWSAPRRQQFFSYNNHNDDNNNVTYKTKYALAANALSHVMFKQKCFQSNPEDVLYAGLLMRPEHSETKAKTETRECETKIETKTKTKKLL